MKSIEEKNKAIEEFIKESMCIDGTVKYDKVVTICSSYNKVIKGTLFQIKDKKRGTFYIAWLK